MKLEVGQKIGIYEVLSTPYEDINKGDQILCKDIGNLSYPIMMLNSNELFSRSEVRKVGSLIVKRLK